MKKRRGGITTIKTKDNPLSAYDNIENYQLAIKADFPFPLPSLNDSGSGEHMNNFNSNQTRMAITIDYLGKAITVKSCYVS